MLAIPVAVAVGRADRDGLLGSASHYTVRLVWHEMLRSRADVALIVLGVVLFAAGGAVIALAESGSADGWDSVLDGVHWPERRKRRE